MTITSLTTLAHWIDSALEAEPPLLLKDICDQWYSPYYFFMYRAAQHLRNAGLLVELGCDQGRGLAALALGGGNVIGIDHTRKVGMDRVQSTFDNVLFLQQASMPVPSHFNDVRQKIALLHIDTEHSFAQAESEFNMYRPYLAPQAVVIFDDLHAQEDDVMRFMVSLPYPKIIDDRLHPSCGWGVVLYDEGL